MYLASGWIYYPNYLTSKKIGVCPWLYVGYLYAAFWH